MFNTFSLKTTAAAAAIALGAFVASAANATTLTGTFTIDIYNYDGGSSDATADNVDDHAGDLVGSVTYTGSIDFYTDDTDTTPTIGQFLDSGSGSYTALDQSVLDLTMSATGFATTTLLDITGEFSTGVTGTITHDDGIALYDAYGAVLVDSSAPTSPIGTDFAADAGGFRLVYSAANGNPEQLNVDTTPAPVPLPAAGLLMVGALGGLGALRRRKARTA